VIIPALAEFFEGDISTFQKFISDNAKNNFDLNVPERKIELIEEEWTAPYIIGDIKPMFAGKKFKFKVI